MKIILLQHLSGRKSYDAGEELEKSDLEAFRMISKGIAKAKSAKAHNDLMVRIQKIEEEHAEKEQKLVAIQREEQLKESASALLDELVKVVDTIASVSPEYRDAFLASFHERFTPRGEAE